MDIIPAIDIKDGNSVRLIQGRMEDEKVYSTGTAAMAYKWKNKRREIITPANVALYYKQHGASIIHIVDLNGAFEGKGVNDCAVLEAVNTIKGETLIQLGGGIRDMARIETLLKMGIDRVIIGTAAIENPNLVQRAIEKYGPSRIIVGIDAKGGIVATRGWAKSGNLNAIELALKMKEIGVTRIIYTDISRDGMLKGPNINETKLMAEKTGMLITASGGVSSLDDISKLKKIENMGIDSVIVGKALYEERFTLEEANEVAHFVEDGFLGEEYVNYYNQIKVNHKSLFSNSSNLNKLCHKVMAQIIVHNEDAREIIVSTLFLQSVSTFQSIIILTERGLQHEATILLRTFIEIMLKLIAIKIDEYSLYAYLSQEDKIKENFLKKLEKHTNWHDRLDGIDSIRKSKNEAKDRYNQYIKKFNLKKKDVQNFGPAIIENRFTENQFNESQLIRDYFVVYSLLYQEVHSTPYSLQERFKINVSNKIYEIIYGPTDKDIERIVSTAIHGMTFILDSIIDLFEIKDKDSIDTTKTQLNNIRNKLSLK